MLPLPFSPSSSLAMFTARLRTMSLNPSLRTGIAFWIFGLLNNLLYVIILSAALDLVGPSVPKSLVLLADILPSLIIKLIAPYFIHLIPYPVRVVCFIVTSSVAMVVIGFAAPPDTLAPSLGNSQLGKGLGLKMVGIVLASLSSGAGELSFLSLTHYYPQTSLAAWGCGTGAAGLVGAGMYSLCTTVGGWSVRRTMCVSAVLPLGMGVGYWVVLPRQMVGKRGREEEEVGEEGGRKRGGEEEGHEPETQGLLSRSQDEDGSVKATRKDEILPWMMSVRRNLRRSRGLFFPLWVSPLLAYIAVSLSLPLSLSLHTF